MITNAPAARLLELSAQSLLWQMVQRAVVDGQTLVVELPLSTGATVQANSIGFTVSSSTRKALSTRQTLTANGFRNSSRSAPAGNAGVFSSKM